ncbi:endo-1,4-beta-xylanase [Methylobacterium sp. J-077]|uniref:endo-1,4-beta-xylanase n=1 Tax=Methylobacterium sp. J-077 TaxID=2836656 RepID=UPI001FBB65CD|nr:endo-1,4-beta-xylanase [Methylobacterium sp. J-077]MCJ2121173.1 endo-1,4-beta-xylanase [Methylobacterium sp. J-077]
MIPPPGLPSRRALLAGAACAGLATAARGAPSGFGPLGEPSWSADSLQAAASAKGLLYGCEVPFHRFDSTPAYRQAVARECGILVCGTEMKMEEVLPAPGRTDFTRGDAILRFARSNGQRMRGHTLVWHAALPPWVAPLLGRASPVQAEDFMRRWIETVAGHYRGQIVAWDVVNEILGNEADPDRGGGLRESPWLAAMGPGYVDRAFRILHETDPAAAGTWNEDAVEQGAPWMEAKRTKVLRQLEAMRSRGVPIRRFGLQSHLTGTVPIDQAQLRRFLHEIGQMGLGIAVTELDIDDRAFPSDVATRDRMVADFARRYLDVVLAEPALLDVLTWDIYDPDTWLNDHPYRKRPDGLPQRALPLDAQFRRKPLWHAMQDCFRAAPDHTAAREKLRRG